MISTAELRKLFEKIATVHTVIGHDEPNGVIRFFGYNSDEAIAKERNELTFPCLGLGEDSLPGRYHKQAGATGDTLTISVDVTDKAEVGNYAQEEAAYDKMKKVQDDIITWLHEVVSGELRYDFPAVCQLDLDSVEYRKIGPVLSGAFGWRMSIKVKDSLLYDKQANPLKNMTP